MCQYWVTTGWHLCPYTKMTKWLRNDIFHPASPPSCWLMYGAMVLIVPHKAYGPPVLAGQTEGLLSLKPGPLWAQHGRVGGAEACNSCFAGSHRHSAATVKTNEKEGPVMETFTNKQKNTPSVNCTQMCRVAEACCFSAETTGAFL